MRTLKELVMWDTTTEINGKWVPARPLNVKKGYATISDRIKDAWAVFTCKAEAFKWPEGQ